MKSCKYCGTTEDLYSQKTRKGIHTIYNYCNKCRFAHNSKAHKGQISWNTNIGHSKETCEKISKNSMGKIVSEKTKQILSIKLKEMWQNFTEEQKANRNKKISKKLKGKPSKLKNTIRSLDVRQKISKTLLGHKGALLGKHHSIETKQKIRESNIKYIELHRLNGETLCPRIGKNETLILDSIEKEGDNKVFRQWPVVGYFLDGYDPINNIAYEVNEKYHTNPEQMAKDEQRQLNIIQHLGCEWVDIEDY